MPNDFMDYLRFANVFGNPPAPTMGGVYPSPSINMERIPPMGAMPNVTPPTNNPDFISKYFDLLTRTPAREEPGGWRKFAALLASGLTGYAHGPEAGIGMGQHILEGRNRRNFARHEQELDRTGKAAQFQMGIGDAEFKRKMEQLKAEREGRELTVKENTATADIALKNAQAKEIETKLTQGDFGWDEIDGKLFIVNKKTGTVEEINTGAMSTAELEAFKHRHAMQRISAEQDAITGRSNAQIASNEKLQGARIAAGVYERPNAGDSSLEGRRVVEDKVRSIMLNPEQKAKYGEFIDPDTLTIKSPEDYTGILGSGIGAKTVTPAQKQRYDELLSMLGLKAKGTEVVPPTDDVPAEVKTVLAGKPDNEYTLSDGSVWVIQNGVVRRK